MTEKKDAKLSNHNRGIITDSTVQALDTFLKKNNNKTLVEAVKLEEPNLLPAIKSTVDDVASYFIDSGVGAKTTSLIRDACFTCMLRGFFLYRQAVKDWDAKKLSEMYNVDFEKWEDELIDIALKAKQVAASGKIDG